METTFIYTLSDKNGNIRYIGKSNEPRKRLYCTKPVLKRNRSVKNRKNYALE